MGEQLFTVEEANALIPKLEFIMAKLQRHGMELRQQVSEVAHALQEEPETLTTAQILGLRPQLRPVVEELEGLLAEIEACGGQLKGLELGLVDFPAEMDGDVVLLCWQYGEKEIAYYHALEDGFAQRKHLDPGRRPSQHLQ